MSVWKIIYEGIFKLNFSVNLFKRKIIIHFLSVLFFWTYWNCTLIFLFFDSFFLWTDTTRIIIVGSWFSSLNVVNMKCTTPSGGRRSRTPLLLTYDDFSVILLDLNAHSVALEYIFQLPLKWHWEVFVYKDNRKDGLNFFSNILVWITRMIFKIFWIIYVLSRKTESKILSRHYDEYIFIWITGVTQKKSWMWVTNF